jgi:hypothetical protein
VCRGALERAPPLVAIELDDIVAAFREPAGEAILALMPNRGQAFKGKGNRSTINKAKLRLTCWRDRHPR